MTNSIDRNQPEPSLEHLAGRPAIEKIKELVRKSATCFFCTRASSGAESARPMSCQLVDDGGNLWFLSADDSHKNRELMSDQAVTLYFQGSAHSDFLQLHGTATVSRDRAKIEQLWEFAIKTWFTEGKDDPRITVIKVSPTDGYYWDTKHGSAVAGIKILVGAVIGKTLDDSIQGKLRV